MKTIFNRTLSLVLGVGLAGAVTGCVVEPRERVVERTYVTDSAGVTRETVVVEQEPPPVVVVPGPVIVGGGYWYHGGGYYRRGYWR